MKKLLAVAVLLLTALSGLSQGVRIQAFTTNSGPVVTNIVINLSSNLLPNRLAVTNPTISALRVYAATNQNTAGFWLDPGTLTPGSATNVIDVAASTGIVVVTNALLRTFSTPALTNNEARSVTFSNVVTFQEKIMNPAMDMDYASPAAAVFWAPDGTLFRSRNGSILTNLTGTGGSSSNLLNGSGQVVIYGNSMEMVDRSTGWTNVNWSDQTLSTANTNVLDWFNQRLIGPWLADNLSGNGGGLTNISPSVLTNLNYTSQYYTNMAQKRSAVTNQFRYINVLDYMGIRNSGNLANDTVAFQMAMDATTNSPAGVNLAVQDAALAEIYVPEGTYYINNTIWFRRWGTKLRGAGQTRTKINFVNTTTNMFGFLPTTGSGSTPITWLYGISIEGIYASSFATTTSNRSTFLKLSSVLPPSEDFIGGNWTFKDIQLENFYRGFDLRFINMALFENVRHYIVNTAYWLDTPQNVVINMGQVFGGRTYNASFNPAYTNLFGPNAEPSVGIMVTNSGFSGASMGVTALGWELGDADSAVRTYQGMISVIGGNFERMHTNVFETHLSTAGYFVNNRMGHMAGGSQQPYFDLYDNTASRSTIVGSVEYGNDSTHQIRVHTNGIGGLVHYTGRTVQVTNTVEAIQYFVPFATNRVVVTGSGGVTVTPSQAGPITTYDVSGGGSGSGIETNGGTGLFNKFTNATFSGTVWFNNSNSIISPFGHFNSLTRNLVTLGDENNYNSASGGATNNSILGGARNTNDVASTHSTIVNGLHNWINAGSHSFIGAGLYNQINTSTHTVIAGGLSNAVYDGSSYNFIFGRNNIVSGELASTGDYNIVLGSYARTTNNGVFIYSDNSSTTPFYSTADNTFNVRAAGGINLQGSITSGATFTGNTLVVSNATTGAYTEVQPGSLLVTNETGAEVRLTNGFFFGSSVFLKTNLATSLALTAGKAYITNLAGNIVLTAFVDVPTDKLWSTYLLATNATASTFSVTFPAGVKGGGNGSPAVFYVTNGTQAEFQINGWAQTMTNVNWSPHW